MKILCYILSIYILSLLAYPCQDKCDHSYTHKTEKSTDQNHEKEDCHNCSPFCTCNCCSVSTILTFKATIITSETIPVLFVSVYKEAPLKDIVFSIWQPPKA